MKTIITVLTFGIVLIGADLARAAGEGGGGTFPNPPSQGNYQPLPGCQGRSRGRSNYYRRFETCDQAAAQCNYYDRVNPVYDLYFRRYFYFCQKLDNTPPGNGY